MPIPRNSHCGFTLIELLVVIAIIAILAALLTPALKDALEQGKASVCASNLRQVPIGLRGYMSDYDGWMPPYVSYHSDSKSYTGPDGVSYINYRRNWLHTLWFKSGPYLDPFRGGDGFLAPYMGTQRGSEYGVMGCPARPDGSMSVTSNGASYTLHAEHQKSLGINLSATRWYEDGEPGNPRHVEEINNPQHFVIFSDTSGTTAYSIRPSRYSRWEWNTATAPAPRHFEKFNATFLDGHVDRGSIRELYTTKHFVP